MRLAARVSVVECHRETPRLGGAASPNRAGPWIGLFPPVASSLVGSSQQTLHFVAISDFGHSLDSF